MESLVIRNAAPVDFLISELLKKRSRKNHSGLPAESLKISICRLSDCMKNTLSKGMLRTRAE